MKARVKDAIERDFSELHSRLRRLEKVYNPEGKNLIFYPLSKAHAELYSALLSLSRQGLDAVHRRRDYFLQHVLYDDGMFWDDLFEMTSAAALRIMADKGQMTIPGELVRELTEILVEISEYATVDPGDCTKRAYEALGNTLLAFYDKNLIKVVRKKAHEIGSTRVTKFLEWTIEKVEKRHPKGKRRGPPRPRVHDVLGGTAVRKSRKEPSWRHAEVFPIIARLIGEEYQRHHRHITAHEIVAALLQDGEARAIIDGAREQLQRDWSPEHLASNMVAWFSQRITVGQSAWRRAFERTKVHGQWAYRPTQTVTTG